MDVKGQQGQLQNNDAIFAAVTFVNVRDPYALSSSPELDEDPDGHSASLGDQETGNPRAKHTGYTHMDQTSTGGLEASSAAPLYIPSEAGVAQHSVPFPGEDLEDLQSPPTKNGVSPQTHTNLAPPGGSLDYILNPDLTLPQPIYPNLESLDGIHDMTADYQRLPKARTSQVKASTETSHQSAFMMRHFSEVTGRWMDLFDQATFFSSHIPVKSISNPLLKHAACAYAAKQLARVNGTKAITGGSCLQQANAAWEDWTLLSAQHYDQAISLLMDALNWDHGSAEANSSKEIDKRHYAPRTVEGMVAERKLRRRQFESEQSTAKSDDLLAATSILCEYESLDASTAAWTRHLSGTKSLLDVVEVGMMPLDTVVNPEAFRVPQRLRKPSQARRAIFWNFARQDLFAAFVNECRTRLDTEDVPLWRDAGLLLDENDLVVPSNTAELDLPEEDLMREDMMGNALIWLMSKLMNLICTSVGDDGSPGSARLGNPHVTLPEMDSRQQSLFEKWSRLDHEIETWYNGLPETFMPSAIITVRPHGADLTEVWHSVSICAATLLSWHMASILMLVNKPHDEPARTSTIAARVNVFRNMQSDITFHSRQILGLCLARPDASVRIHALQPLFVAGQCLTETAERRVVLDLLRGIERDLGWATEYRVRQLLQEWEWDNEEGSAQG
ncbi:MAG: hypothetical protein Q9201_006113 [Fulgogasparrea decipioides]